MAHPLQDKDAQWRRRRNDAAPLFDPGLAPPGTDEEAGGAHSSPAAPGGPADSLPIEHSGQSGGVRLTSVFWYGCAALLAVIMVALGLISLL